LLQESLERSRREFDRDLAESRAKFDRDLAESRAKFDRDLAESRAEFDRRSAEAEKRLARTEAIAAQANQAVNSLTSRWEHFVENLLAPSVIDLFQERGIETDYTCQRMRWPTGAPDWEVDVFAIGHDVGVVVEVKSRLTQDQVVRMLRNLDRFKTIFPRYVNHRIYGALGAIEIDRDVDSYAENQGLFVIEQSGETVCISTEMDFIPRIW
jgi:hypothetical protein